MHSLDGYDSLFITIDFYVIKGPACLYFFLIPISY